MDELFYDGRCPSCLRGVALLGRYSDSGLQLTDLHQAIIRAGEPGHLLLLTTPHLRTGDGAWITGLEAVLQAWSHTRFGSLLGFLRWPVVTTLADCFYSWWTLRRYRRRYSCKDCH